MMLFNRVGECRHKFEGRWDETPTDCAMKQAIIQGEVYTLITRVYVRDICVKCGKTIEREGK